MTITLDAAPQLSLIESPPDIQVPTAGKLLDTLEALGSSQAIAAFFLKEGVRGRRRSARECPIAKWLHIMTGKDHSVASAIRDLSNNHLVASCQNRYCVRAFMRDFDMGCYPQLAVSPARSWYAKLTFTAI